MRKPERSVSKTYGHFVFAAREILSTGCERHPTRSSLQVLGYSSKGAPQSANKLRKRSDVRGRVDEIRQAAANSTAAEVAFDQQRVLNLLDVLSHKAEDLGQISVAVRGMFIDRQVAEVAISSEPSIAEVLRMRRAKREEQEKAAADGPTLLTGRTDVIDPKVMGGRCSA